jgi:ParB family chromosome partitioning protein
MNQTTDMPENKVVVDVVVGAGRWAIDVRLIPLERLRESPFNPRRRYDPNRLVEMAASIKQQGIIEPLVVRPLLRSGEMVADLGQAMFEIVAGSRRFRAAKLAQQVSVPAIVRTDVDDDTAIKIMTIENIQREDVHPLEEAEGYQLLMKRGQYDAPGLAVVIGKSESYVYQRLKLLELGAEVKKAFLADKISAGHAILLARLTPPDQKLALVECVRDEEPLSVRGLWQWIEQEIHRDLGRVPFDVKDGGLLPRAGACVTCPKRSGTQPSLFPDIDSGDTCLDPACFKSKLAAFVGRREVELKKAQEAVVKVTTDRYAYGQEKGLMAPSEYTKAGARKCPDTKVALVAGGAGLGTDFKICTNPRCKVHHPAAPRHESTPAEKRVRKQIQVDKLAEERILVAALKSVTARGVGVKDLQLVAIASLGDLFGDGGNVLCDLHGLPYKKGVWNSAHTALVKEVGRCTNRERLIQWALEGAICGLSRDDLEEVAKRRDVNVAAVKKQVAAELEAAKAKPQPSAKPKAKK